jgi:hypothetical protein
MGTISGLEFVAEVILDSGPTVITYLVRDFDLETESTEKNWTRATIDVAEEMEAAAEAKKPGRSRLN